jgi:myosin heavy subunit
LFGIVAGDSEQFYYLNQGSSPTVQTIDDAEDFVSMRQALTILG